MIFNAPPDGPEKFGSRDHQLTIGYLAPHAYGKISLEILSGIIQGAKDHGVNLVCISGGLTLTQFEEKRDTLSAYRFINPRNLDGLIVWTTALNFYIDEGRVKPFLDRFHPLPMVGIAQPVSGISTIIQDCVQSVRAVMQHIIGAHGFRKIVYIQGPEAQYIGRTRNQAFFQQLAEYGIPLQTDLVVTTRLFDKTAGNDGVRTLLVERGLRPGIDFEVIVACSDRIASGVIEELHRHGVKVPDTVSVVGFNNSPESLTYPALTTVEPHFYQHGYQAMESILALVRGGQFPEIIPLPGELIVRESCGCIEEAVTKARAVSDEGRVRYSFAREPFLKAVAAERERMLSRLREEDGLPALPAEWLDHLFDCFLGQLNHAGNEFLHALKKYLNDSSTSQNHLGTWQNAISALRKALLPYFDSPALLLEAEDIWNQARVMINLVAVNIPDSLKLGYIVNSNMMAQSIRLFTTASDLESLLETIANRIIQLNISFCCLVLYGDGHSGLCRLELVIRDGKRMAIPDDCRVFERSRLLPERLLREEPGRNLIVEPCVFEEDNLGYLVLQMNHVDGSLYESIRISASMALKNTFHVQELIKTKEEKDRLYQVLRQQNAELEQRAIEVGQAYDRLKQAVAEAHRANQAKSVFLANMSHEIRTPINCILGFAEILNDIEAGPERAEYQRKIIEESNRLLELINQLLDISKIEAGKLELHEELFHLPDLLQGVSSTFEVIARNKGLTYQLELQPGLPSVVIGDALRLRQILVNLIGNAVKFTFEGGVRVRVAVRAGQGAAVRLLFEIIDTGIGIPPNRVGAIFETFVQAEDSTTRKFGGTGLGTAISKQLVQMMGGEIGVDSEEGKGSNFHFTVALKNPPAQEETAAAAAAEAPVRSQEPAFSHCRMLLAEDYPTNRMVVIAHLQKLKLAIEIAENGREAVEKFKAGRYDFILMDVQMPEMDGYEATRLIRQEPNGKTVPIVAMTASAFEQDIQQCLEAGMNDVITKPFRKDAFLEKITYWLTKGG